MKKQGVQADGQKLRIEVFDEDRGQDEELGRLSINLANIQRKGTVQKVSFALYSFGNDFYY